MKVYYFFIQIINRIRRLSPKNFLILKLACFAIDVIILLLKSKIQFNLYGEIDFY